jgi:hypothetical protein
MRVVDLQGSAFERGRQQGEELRAEYQRLLDTFLGSPLWRDNRPWFISDRLATQVFSVLGLTCIRSAVRKHLPVQAERIEGLAAGLGISSALAWGVQFLEILFCEAGQGLKVPGGCTQIHATGSATKSGTPLSGRNYDFPNLLREFQVVRRELPAEPGRLATTSATQVPLAGCHQGINEAGLMVAANNARLFKGRDFRTRGVPYMLLMMEILETCHTAAGAAEIIRSFPHRTNAGFFGIVDASGDCRVVEFTASRSAVRVADEAGVLAQTNHFHLLEDANLPEGTHWTVEGMAGLEYAASTQPRFEVADRMLHEQQGAIDIESLQRILRDHSHNDGVGSDSTVCCHGVSGSTLGSFIVDVASRSMWVAEGSPCEGDYLEIPFRSAESAPGGAADQ